MEDADIEAKVKAEMVSQFGVTEERLVRDAKFADFGGDGLDIVELIIAIEEDFGICIYDDEAKKLDTVGKMIDIVKEKVNGKS